MADVTLGSVTYYCKAVKFALALLIAACEKYNLC